MNRNIKNKILDIHAKNIWMERMKKISREINQKIFCNSLYKYKTHNCRILTTFYCKRCGNQRISEIYKDNYIYTCIINLFLCEYCDRKKIKIPKNY